MLSSLLRPKRRPRHRPSFNSSSPPPQSQSPTLQRRRSEQIRHAQADWTETENEDDDEESGRSELPRGRDNDDDSQAEEEFDNDAEEEEDGQVDEDGDATTALLPIFSAAHLDSLPVYNLTHAIRLVITSRVETTLTWDQLRSPQVSQFLVKPMQQQIRAAHFSRATIYALMANCLQFNKEGTDQPGSAGTCRTRANICELLAIKLLKEYSIRELIDALSYDFYPLQGLDSMSQPQQLDRQTSAFRNRAKGSAARISSLEVAIRASAKRFLAHPLVVQQLEAIWAGTIVFHSNADHLHRTPANSNSKTSTNSTMRTQNECSSLLPQSSRRSSKAQPRQRIYSEQVQSSSRRTVTLYDPRDASIFKLSRLRVPRYRQFFSTCSLAVLLFLFVAVLKQRSSSITQLELVFWVWSAGFMLDEVVGFNEQGFSLYLLSFWNVFDIGILMVLFVYYCMRFYGIFLIGAGRHDWNSMAYDVLAANAVLLFPRLFSVLDHSRYFSQLLIAFRLMAVDLVAVFVLIIISCSGFFVAFTLSFGEDYDAGAVAYGLFQMIMGFTPAAWTLWDNYNPLGKAILTLFLFICHFLIVTILITVLTNSFMTIVSNANEEHQFLFAVNTISMVKSDSLFSYLAPSNLLAWLLTPLRYVMPFRHYVRLNRYVIKTTHFPLLFGVYAYETLFLARRVYDATDLVEKKHSSRPRMISFMDPERRATIFNPTVRVRQESLAGIHKDRALDEVFTLGPRGAQRIAAKEQQTKNNVASWMDQNEGIAKSPTEQDRSIVDRLERNRQRRESRRRTRPQRTSSGLRSHFSDPADKISPGLSGRPYGHSDTGGPTPDMPTHHHTEDEGDDELVTNDEHDDNMTVNTTRSRDRKQKAGDYFLLAPSTVSTPQRNRSATQLDGSQLQPSFDPVTAIKHRGHQRNLSSNTILYNPDDEFNRNEVKRSRKSNASTSISPPKPSFTRTGRNTGTSTPRNGNNDQADIYSRSQPRPILQSRNTLAAVPRPKGLNLRHRRSSLDMPLDLTSDVGLGDNLIGAVPSSFQTQMAFASRMNKQRAEGEALMGRIMLARMKTLEEGFADVVKEMRKAGSTIPSVAGSASRRNSADEDLKKEKKRMDKGKTPRGSRPGTSTGWLYNEDRRPLHSNKAGLVSKPGSRDGLVGEGKAGLNSTSADDKENNNA